MAFDVAQKLSTLETRDVLYDTPTTYFVKRYAIMTDTLGPITSRIGYIDR
jgi:hypothetical protein